jgi:hypothetical protein
MFETLSADEFVNLPTNEIFNLLYPQKLSISLLLNGTRRWYISQYLDSPPTDDSYLAHYLETILIRVSSLLTMLAEHGLYRVFLPVYSEQQDRRDAEAYKYLLKGIMALTAYPALLKAYQQSQYAVRFYGDLSAFPQPVIDSINRARALVPCQPRHYLYYDARTTNPHEQMFRLAYEFGQKHGRPATREDMLELYYGDRSLKPLNILVAFNRTYGRMGIPTLLEGEEQIYTTLITPMVMSETVLRRILYDYVFNQHDPSRNYHNLDAGALQTLKRYYTDNENHVLGLTEKRGHLVYGMPETGP